jgi:phytoene dehydrogenase-like protein
MQTDTIIVGAGLGGLAAAIRLQLSGRRVRLLEKNERVGGKMNIVQAEGFTFDTGPSLFTMPWVVRELWAAAGRSADDVLEIAPVDPVCRYAWPDGTRWDHRAALPDLIAEINRLSPPDGINFFRFMAFAGRIYAATAEPL